MSRPIPTARIIECLRETNGAVCVAAKRVPCAITTIYERARKVQAVQRTIDECRGEIIDYAELALRRAVLDGQPWAVALTLRTIGRGRGYVERQEVTGADGGPMIVAIGGIDPSEDI